MAKSSKQYYLVSIQKGDSFRKVKEDVPLKAGLTTPYDLPDLRGRHEYIKVFRGLKSESDPGGMNRLRIPQSRRRDCEK